MGLTKMDKYDSTSFLGSLITVITSLSLSDWGVVMGILFGLLTLLMSWYYKAKELKLKEQYLKQQLKEREDED